MLTVVHGRKLETTSTEETRLVLVKMRFFMWAASYVWLTGKNRAMNMVHKITEEQAKIGDRWLQEIHDTLVEKGMEGQGMDSELWWLRIEDFSHIK
jgi:hypothetical protein